MMIWCSEVLNGEFQEITDQPKCRSRLAETETRAAGEMRDENRMDIYIALPFPFPSFATKPLLLLNHGQKKDRNPTHHRSSLSLSLRPRSSPCLLPQHERNRSVTFLKVSFIHPTVFSSLILFQRKNGLFKKAYELGVLCSVDVAVIVFDNKQGGPRLYQYGSDDVVTIVERAMRVCPAPPSISTDSR